METHTKKLKKVKMVNSKTLKTLDLGVSLHGYHLSKNLRIRTLSDRSEFPAAAERRRTSRSYSEIGLFL